MCKMLNITILMALFLCLISCKDDAVSRFSDNVIKVQLLDSATNKPIAYKEVGVYYALEKTSSNEALYELGVLPNPIFYDMKLYYHLHYSAKIRITLNSVKDYSIIKELYKSDTLEIGNHTTMYNPAEFASGFYMLQYYINDTLTNTMKILIAKNCFVVLDDYLGNIIGNPYSTFVSDKDGMINVDMDKFKDIGTQIQRIMESGDDRGVYEVINGFHCITSINTGDRSLTYRQTVRTAECKDKKFIWKMKTTE